MQGVLPAGKGNTSTLAQLQHAKVPTSPEPPHGTGFVHTCAHRAGDRERTSPPPSSPLLKHQAKGRLQSSSTEAEAFKPLRMLLGDHQLRREQTTLCRCCCSLPRRLRSHLPSLSPTTRASPVAWGMLEHGEMR